MDRIDDVIDLADRLVLGIDVNFQKRTIKIDGYIGKKTFTGKYADIEAFDFLTAMKAKSVF